MRSLPGQLYDILYPIVMLLPPLYIEINVQNVLTAVGLVGWIWFERNLWNRNR